MGHRLPFWTILPVLAALAACGGSGNAGSVPEAAVSNVVPVAVFTATPAEGTAPLEVTFDASLSYDVDGSIDRYRWAFGDSGVGEGRIVRHRFADPGRFAVRLTVTDDRGSAGTGEQDVLVRSESLPPPVRTAGCEELHERLRAAPADSLVALVRGATTHCIRDLRWISDAAIQIAVLTEQNAIAVANAIPSLMETYDGSGTDGILQTFLFLQMLQDIHEWCLTRMSCEQPEWESAAVYPLGPGSPAFEAVLAAVDSFVEHPRFMNRDRGHAGHAIEVAQTIIAFGMSGNYLHVVAQWLGEWDYLYASSPIADGAIGRILDIVYRGHRRDGFGQAFGENTELLYALRDFVLHTDWPGSSSQWMVERAVLEIGRYSKYPGTANYERVLPVVDSIRNAYADSAHRDSIWLRLVAEIDYNDPENCGRYDLCGWYGGDGFRSNFRAALFADTLECPSAFCPAESIAVMGQDLTSDQLELACRRLRDHASVFQAMFDTGCTPVRDDSNRHLNVFVFNDGRTCEDMESAAFFRNADTCSGVYYEGDPADPDTVAEMVVTEYTPDERPPDPELSIWNFEHEYGHYLDGRYNRHGSYRGGDDSIHWWTEGFAEYFAAATSPHKGLPARESPYSLTDTLLHSDSIPTRYAHRHLAVHYLMTNHRGFVEELLGFMRRGEYGAYTSHMRSEAPKYETSWREWLRQGSD